MFVLFYFALSSAKSNNDNILTVDQPFPLPARYCAQSVVGNATGSIAGTVYIKRDAPNVIKCNGPVSAGDYLIAQFCYVTNE